MLAIQLLGIKLPGCYYSYTENLALIVSLGFSGALASILNISVGASQLAWKQFAF